MKTKMYQRERFDERIDQRERCNERMDQRRKWLKWMKERVKLICNRESNKEGSMKRQISDREMDEKEGEIEWIRKKEGYENGLEIEGKRGK